METQRGSFRAQQELAAREAEEFKQTVGKAAYTNIDLLYGYVCNAFSYAVQLAMMTRTNEPMAADQFVAAVVRLGEYAKHVKESMQSKTVVDNWPKNPGTIFCWLAGRNALEVAIKFVDMICAGTVVARGEVASHGRTSYDNLPVCPKCDKSFEEWRDRTIKELLAHQIPKPDVWPSMADIHREFQSIKYKLEDEYQKAIDTQEHNMKQLKRQESLFEQLKKYKSAEDYFSLLEEYKHKPSETPYLTNPLLCFMDEIDRECGTIVNDLILGLDLLKKKKAGDNKIDDKMVKDSLCQAHLHISELIKNTKKGYWGYRWKLLSEIRTILSKVKNLLFLKNHRAPLGYVLEEFDIAEKYLERLQDAHIKHIELKEAFNEKLKKMPFEQAVKNIFEKDSSVKSETKSKNIPVRVQKLVMQESSGICAVCGESDVATLEFHHINGRDIPDPHLAENIIYVCKNCHGKITAGQISKDEVIMHKKNHKTRNKANGTTVQNIKIYGGTQRDIAHTINNIYIKGTRLPTQKLLPPAGAIASDLACRNYLKYLIDRYHEFAQIEKKEAFRPAVVYGSIKREFGATWEMIPLHRFEDVCNYMHTRIDNTAFGRKQKKQNVTRYDTFDKFCETKHFGAK